MSETKKKWDDITVNTDFGAKANVRRDQLKDDQIVTHNQVLRAIGERIRHENKSLMAGQYIGSAAVHIYYREGLNEVDFVSQIAPMDKVNEHIASKAFEALRGDWQEAYGRQRMVRRSGF